MQLARLVETVQRVRATTKKSEKIRLLAECLGQVNGREAVLAALYLTGSLPQGKIGIGWSVIQKAMHDAPASGEPLMLSDVDRLMDVLAAERGAGSMDRRILALSNLFSRANPQERTFLSQLLIGEVRQGALEAVLLDAIAAAAGLPAAEVRQAFMFAPNIGDLAQAALEEQSAGLARFSMRLFVPVAPMLANSAEDVDEALQRLDRAVFEYKLDGARVQVHKGGDDVRVFTRQLQDITGRLPEIVEWARNLPVREAVLDGEAIALRPDGRPQPFQTTMRRLGRIKDVAAMRESIPLSPFAFDALYLDGSSLLTQSYEERLRALATMTPAELIPHVVTSQPEEARRFLAQSLAAGHEGVMAKSPTAPYVAGQRGYHWLKLKEATSLDLVILAAEWGNGRREGWLSNLHLGARDPSSGHFVMLGKTFKGLTDEMLRQQTEQLLSLETHREEHTVFVKHQMVVEIAFSDIQESPRYPAGLALRFARVKRYRPDKTPDQADTIQTVSELFRAQRN
ncbi:putative DNA ligase [Nitrospira sp. KM1]|uniref:ATP-dependent DNA ligase n=1 Tax=Nitrospira sp. KM1 TaxID=1936990 RepID=UPI0013A77D89|nr:ATP-dependent DNA ligase [Nitrospira sp. KM1]BCA56276.1 putative DNA ligase [Nitrospira sp. KM1]